MNLIKLGVATCLLALALTACGQRGPLYLPEPEPEPAATQEQDEKDEENS